MSVGTYADYGHCTGLAGCMYGVTFNTSHYFFVIVISLMEPIGDITLVEEGSTSF